MPESSGVQPGTHNGAVDASAARALGVAQSALDTQMGQIDALDTKAGFILASASLLTGVLVLWHAPPPRIHAPGIVYWLPGIARAVGGGRRGTTTGAS